MPESDWSQFLPSFIVGIILLVVPTVTAFMFKGFRDWASKAIDKLIEFANEAGKLAMHYWSYSLALLILIVAVIVFGVAIKNPQLTGIFAAGVGISLLVFEMAIALPFIFPKRTKILFRSIHLTSEVGNSKLASKYIDPPKGTLYSENR